jgi:hypothetical protein
MPLTPVPPAATADAVKRLEIAGVRICQRCGRGRADLTAPDGTTITVPIDPARAQELAAPGSDDEVPWLSSVLLGLLRGGGLALREIVLDTADHGLRALVSLAREKDTEIIVCTPQEGVGLAVRGKVPLYATAEALAATTETSDGGGETLH